MANPKLRFKDNKKDYKNWETKPFLEAFTIISNNSYAKEKLSYTNGNVLNIHYGDVLIRYEANLDVKNTPIPLITDKKDAEDAVKKGTLVTGDVVIADAAEDEIAGKATEIINQTNEQIVSGQHTIGCKTTPNMFEPGFLGYYLNSPAYHSQIFHILRITKVLSINHTDITETKISVPDKKEQRKIADFFSDIDAQIKNYRKALLNLLKQRKEFIQKVFSQELRFQKDDGSDYPDWKTDLFENICIVNPRSGQIDDEFYYIDLESVNHGRLLSERIEQKESAPSRAKRLLKQDDVLFQTVRPYLMGHYYFAKNRDKQVVASTGFAQLRMRHGCNKFLYHFLYSESFNHEVTKSCNEGHYPAINATSLKKIPICIPSSIEEQRKIADFFSDFEERIELERQRLQAMRELKKGLLQQMFC